jgi:hypothetical protein
MRNELLTAIKTRYAAAAGSSLRNLTPGGMWAGVGSSGRTRPVINMRIIGGDYEDTLQSNSSTVGVQIEDVQIDFIVSDTDTDSTAAWSAIKELHQVYNRQDMTLGNNYYLVQGHRQSPGVELELINDGGWEITAPYLFTVAKNGG